MESEEIEELVEFRKHFVANRCKVGICRSARRVRYQVGYKIIDTCLDETDG